MLLFTGTTSYDNATIKYLLLWSCLTEIALIVCFLGVMRFTGQACGNGLSSLHLDVPFFLAKNLLQMSFIFNRFDFLMASH